MMLIKVSHCQHQDQHLFSLLSTYFSALLQYFIETMVSINVEGAMQIESE